MNYHIFEGAISIDSKVVFESCLLFDLDLDPHSDHRVIRDHFD